MIEHRMRAPFLLGNALKTNRLVFSLHPLSLHCRVASLTRSDASLPHDGPVSVDHGNGVGVTGLSNDKSGQDIPMKSFGTLAAISEESTSSSYSSPPGPIDLDGEQGEQLVDKATAHAHADALALKEHPAVTVGLVNARSAANLRALAAAECQRNTPLLSSSSRQPRCSSGDLESRTIMDVSFDLISVQCKCRNCDETASINLVDNITATARKRLQEGRGGTDTRCALLPFVPHVALPHLADSLPFASIRSVESSGAPMPFGP